MSSDYYKQSDSQSVLKRQMQKLKPVIVIAADDFAWLNDAVSRPVWKTKQELGLLFAATEITFTFCCQPSVVSVLDVQGRL